MRRSLLSGTALLFCLALAAACGNKTEDKAEGPAPSPPAPAPSATAAPPEAPPSPLAVVLESRAPLVFSGVGGGVVVADAERKLFATAMAGGELSAAAMPEALPAEGRILGFAGKLPGSVWLLFEEPAAGKDAAKNPLYRLERGKGAWKRFAEDWRPHLAPWSKGRILAMSTSSGKLKAKVMEPHGDKPSADLPSARLDDEACAKSLRIEGIAALPSGEVFAAGHCSARRYVIVRWAEPAPSPAASAPVLAASAGAPATSPDDAGAPDGGDGDAGAPVEEAGIAGTALLVADAPAGLLHRALVAQGPNDAWALAAEGGEKAHLYRVEGASVKKEALPADLEGAPRALASASDGTLWLVTARGIWKRYPPGEWERVPPPTRQYPEPDPSWEMFDAWAADGDVWISAKHASKEAERHVLLRLRGAKDIVRWP
ncbi:hypothetical protein [Polyangium aurulentum]|uniref:hypothetical protein n=1 Tax=Polyangium aurulentum TaxID=2567896 RepID=UPI0010ADDA9F|nr:hypothetical protein [Polyangium aurulentum]UQA56007.1 hypothetical protein E8A73_032415 [Polyangium aurulentum]